MFSSFYCGAGFSRAYRLRQQPRFTVDISAVKRVAKLVCVLDRALMCPPQEGLRLAGRETLGLFCYYRGTSSRSSFVLAGLRIATLEHAICNCERSHLVKSKERDCGAGRATGDLENTFGRCFRYPLQCCDKVNPRALRTVDTCMCCHMPQ
jgi:hypothetical protein